MYTHIVAWKYKTATSEEEIERHRMRLRSLSNIVPGMIEFEVGSDELGLDRSYDTGLIARYADKDALDKYTVHDQHQAVAAMGKLIAEHVISVDFESNDS